MNRIYDILLFSRWLVGWQSRLSFIITLNVTKQDEKSTWCNYLKVFCNMFMLSFHAKSSCYAFYYCNMFCNISMSFQCTYKVYSINVKCFAKFSLFALNGHWLRHVIINETVKLLLTLYRPLFPPFLLSKAKASCSSLLPPKKVSKNCTLSWALVVTARLTYSLTHSHAQILEMLSHLKIDDILNCQFKTFLTLLCLSCA